MYTTDAFGHVQTLVKPSSQSHPPPLCPFSGGRAESKNI